MAERNWKRLKQSEVMDYGGELPARVVLEHDEEDHSYRTFLETVSADGKTGVKAARFFYWEEEALADHDERLVLLCYMPPQGGLARRLSFDD